MVCQPNRTSEMAKQRRRTKPGFWAGFIFLALLAYALIADWWKQNPALGWTITIAIVATFAFSIYRFPSFRRLLFRTTKTAGESMVYETAVSDREPMPKDTRMRILQRARNKCENPSCRSGVRPHVHHIDSDHRNNDLKNLIAICPNCHTKAHDGVYSPSQLRNWLRTSWETYKRNNPRYRH